MQFLLNMSALMVVVREIHSAIVLHYIRTCRSWFCGQMVQFWFCFVNWGIWMFPHHGLTFWFWCELKSSDLQLIKPSTVKLISSACKSLDLPVFISESSFKSVRPHLNFYNKRWLIFGLRPLGHKSPIIWISLWLTLFTLGNLWDYTHHDCLHHVS